MPPRRPRDPADCPHAMRVVKRLFDPTTKEDKGRATVCEACQTVIGWLDRE